jgi:hypothetical protein
LRHLFVIARNSSFTYKGKAVDARQVGRELGVRYLLEGSVQRAVETVRINAQLIEAETGRHLWAERYDRSHADIFAIQDDITDKILTELRVKLLSGEQVRNWRRSTRSREAYEFWAQGWSLQGSHTREDIAKGRELAEKALEIDPKFTMAMVSIGWTHNTAGDAGWSDDATESYRQAVAWGRKAIALDDSLGEAHAMVANVLLTLEQHREALTEAEKALKVSPNDANVLAASAYVLAYSGRADEAVVLMQRAMRLNPFPPPLVLRRIGGQPHVCQASRRSDAGPSARRRAHPKPPLLPTGSNRGLCSPRKNRPGRRPSQGGPTDQPQDHRCGQYIRARDCGPNATSENRLRLPPSRPEVGRGGQRFTKTEQPRIAATLSGLQKTPRL